MGSFNVFDNLNKFLDKDDDSFNYSGLDSTPEVSFAKPEEKNSSNFVDLSVLDVEQPRSSPRIKKRDSNESSPTPDESFDLTDGSFQYSPPKRSRRAADKAQVVETVELFADPPEPTATVTRGLRSRGRKSTPVEPVKKGPKPKRMTYKKALALINAPIPLSPDEMPAGRGRKKATVQETTSRPIIPAASSNTWDIDLTGDVVLTDKHSSAPLFQKSSPKKKTVEIESSSDSDEDLLNYDVDSIKVKVRLDQGIKPFSYRRHQRFYDLFKAISEQNNIPVSNIFLYDGDKRILPDDTPNSTGYKISTILTCRVMEAKAGEYTTGSKKNQVELKFQSDKWKKPVAVKISKFDSLKTAIDSLCEQMPQFKPDQFSLQFDGDDVNTNDTPVDLEFEGGEILDCRIKA